MAWTTPYTFTTGQVVTAAQMNTYISDNLSHLGAMTRGGTALNALTAGTELVDHRSDRAQLAANVDTTNNTYTTVTGLTVTPTVIHKGVILIIAWFRGSHLTAGFGQWQLTRTAGDGTLQTLSTRVLAAGSSDSFTLIGRNTGHTTATQTFALQQKTDGSGTVRTERGEILAITL